MSQRLKQKLEVRCASCRRLFTTAEAGRIRCSWCGAEVELEVDPHLLAPESPPVAEHPGPADRPPPGGEPPSPAPIEEIPAASLSTDFVPAEQSPWEDTRLGIVRRLTTTLRQAMLQPGEFFSHLGEAPPWRALLFGWLLATLAAAVFAATTLWEVNYNPQGWLDATGIAPGADPQQLLDRTRQVLETTLWTSPLLGLLNVLLSALFYHLGIWLLTKKTAGFSQTLRATAYGCAPLVLVLVPLVGQLLGSFWSLWVQILGLATVHRLAVARAAVAVLIPSTLALLLLGMLV